MLTPSRDASGNYKPFPGYPPQEATTPAGRGVIHYVSGNPEGVLVADPGALAYDESGGIYVKTGPGWNSIGWEARIAPA